MTSSATREFFFSSALQHDGWAKDVHVVATDGIITSINRQVAPSDFSASVEHVDGIALPGMCNVHSHAFQRAFAGLSEYRTSEHDSFWTWRKLMYESANSLTPEDVYTIAKGLYGELKSQGYTWVGEFQYLHNDKDGGLYSEAGIMSNRLVQAARDVGIGICILPVLYQRAGFSGGELDPVQKRFVLSNDQFVDLVQQLRTDWNSDPNVQVGIAFHSLRAVTAETIRTVTEAVRKDDPKTPIHIHVAEQLKEVADCRSTHGARPVEFLLNEAPVDEHWCLIHATHLNPEEVTGIANSKAIVGLCPTTEANLGDGIFPAEEFLDTGGRISIGSDSHVCTNPRSELRLLEYGQRLTKHRRAVLGTDTMSVGRRLYEAAANDGAAALGIAGGNLAVGQRAEFVILDSNHPAIAHAEEDRCLDRYIFCDSGNPVKRTIVA
ncbi:MAG: formimidoylglutamate deiminase [Planctomycetota bacterium]